ncbi:unnamed protein product [Allacma fusca]|uniref:Coiled-coil domain-containing protein 130 n=1 Tax=Allacma fusca TaxID=39272 RepID=A0A8J2LF47_9HEXA|nr:unnamed protein product [Allacma fusca]
MGERKGTNKYYPPDYDPKKGGLNKFQGTHALRERARKLHLGILIIRFEMPYNIWCEGCQSHIGMGVRYNAEKKKVGMYYSTPVYNAEKKKVGMYYSTPVYEFRMKCHLCDNHFEIRTDPGNLDYVIMNGARRQENRWDPTENGQVVPDDKAVGRSLASNAMFKLEHGAKDQGKLRTVKPTLANLEGLQERWKDDYLSNKILRNHFRTKKKELKAEEDRDSAFLQKNSLNIPLLKESVDDVRIAGLIRLQPTQTSEERQVERRLQIEKKSKFPLINDTNPKDYKEKLEKVQKQRTSLGISFPPRRALTPAATTTSTATPESPVIPCPTSSHSSNTSTTESSAGTNSVCVPNNKIGVSLVSGDYGSSSDESL